MNNKTYVYFFSFYYRNNDGSPDFGTFIMPTDTKIRYAFQVTLIARNIATSIGVRTVTILNYQLMRAEAIEGGGSHL